MLTAAAANPNNGGDADMPGVYESFLDPTGLHPLGSRTPFPQLPPVQSNAGMSMRPPYPRTPVALPSSRTPFPRLPPGLPAAGTSMRPPLHPTRHRRRRRRAPIPDVIVERRPRCHSSWRRGRTIAINFDDRPTLGLRGSPKRVLEIERVRCHRHRRHRSPRYGYDCEDYDCYDYYDPSWPLPVPQAVPIMANPVVNPPMAPPTLVVPSHNVIATPTTAVLPHLSPETIESLPRQTVFLPPIHLPGSQANADTQLETVIFPTELINPIDGTLSIIQASPGNNTGAGVISRPIIASPVHSQLANTVAVPAGQSVLPVRSADPLVNRFNDLFQRLSISRRQPATENVPMSQPALFNTAQLNRTNYPPIISPTYPSANIQPTSTLNNGSYQPSTVSPILPANNPSYPPANITAYQSSSFTPSAPKNDPPYSAANITPYSSSVFTPSSSMNNTTYRPTNTAQPTASGIGPYNPANITPYANNPLSQSSSSPMLNSYTRAPSMASSRSFTPFPSLSSTPYGNNNTSPNPLSSAASLSTTTYQPNTTIPRSILRNASSYNPATTTYTRVNPPSVSSSNENISQTTRFI